jgi:hypothetical protein
MMPRISLALLVAMFACGEAEQAPDTPAAKKFVPAMDVNIVSYEDISAEGRKHFLARAVLVTDEIPIPPVVEYVARAIWNQHGEGWDAFTVYVYLEGMNTKAAPWGIGEFSRDGEEKFSTDEMALSGTKFWAQTERAKRGGS